MTDLHPFTITADKEQVTLRASACAVTEPIGGASYGYTPESTLYVLSAIGPGSAVKAAAAMLNRTDRHLTVLRFTDLPQELRWWNNRTIRGHYGGIKASYHRLAMDVWQMMAIVKDRQLVISDDDESLWQFLKGDQFTTPLLRSWLPEVVKQLRTKNYIQNLRSFGCQPCQVRVAQDKLDEIVSTLVTAGALKIEEGRESGE
jgi:hypothetical protein